MTVYSYQCRPVAADEVASLKDGGTATVELDCTPDELFDIFEDASSWPQWVPAIKAVRWTTEPPVGVGTMRDIEFPGGFGAGEVFSHYERGTRFAFYFASCSQPVLQAFGEDYRVEPLAGGRCRLTWTMGMEPRGITKVTILPFRPFLDRTLAKLLSNLADLVRERSGASRR